jgi:hypothetical protein
MARLTHMHPAAALALFAGLVWLLDEEGLDMAAVQKHFDEFHSKIKLDEDDENAKLREKRDLLIADLRARLPASAPTFTNIDLGSYAIGTGVLPLDRNYDIDVGLIFDSSIAAYPDPVELKKLVRDALDYGNRTVVMKRPCVTVNYMRDGKVDYHVDLSVYLPGSPGPLKLARGKESCPLADRKWLDADPRGLIEAINKRFSDADDRAQFRRCIRYLKRWRDEQFSTGKPLSIGLTCAALYWFSPNIDLFTRKPVDLLALKSWVAAMLAHFVDVSTDEGWARRLVVPLPVTPRSDVMAKLTNSQMAVFEQRLKSLHQSLVDAEAEALPEDACVHLHKQFGRDFPVPAKEETAKRVAPAIIHTGTSA